MTFVGVAYIITIIVSVIAAFALVRLATLSGRGASSRYAAKFASSGLSSSETDSMLRQALSEEIRSFVDSQHQCEQISNKVSAIFNKELEEKIRLSSQKLKNRYEKVIEQKSKSEEVAWKTYKKIAGEKRKTEAVIRSIAEGLVVVDAKGKVIMMNPAAEKLLDVSKENKIGKSLLEGMKEEHLVSMSKEAGEGDDREIELISEDEETKRVLKSSSAVIENENGETVGMVAVLSDVTKQRELDRLKSTFVVNVSHELRTPLIAIGKAIDILFSKQAGQLTDTQRQFLAIAARNLKRLSLLINDLLDLSKLEAGKMKIKCQPQRVDKIIEESMTTLSTWAGTKSIKLDKAIAPRLPEVNVDANRIIQVLNNLIGNAIKFTPQGGQVTISAVLRKEQKVVEVSVQDTGIGIAKEDLPKVFDKFYQIAKTTPADVSGTGIGLSVAKEIVTLHGGKIWVESLPKSGVKFLFTLPVV